MGSQWSEFPLGSGKYWSLWLSKKHTLRSSCDIPARFNPMEITKESSQLREDFYPRTKIQKASRTCTKKSLMVHRVQPGIIHLRDFQSGVRASHVLLIRGYSCNGFFCNAHKWCDCLYWSLPGADPHSYCDGVSASFHLFFLLTCADMLGHCLCWHQSVTLSY